jgi:AAA15 family ATPase/GTPase
VNCGDSFLSISSVVHWRGQTQPKNCGVVSACEARALVAVCAPGLNVLVGPNNVGKTAVVDALRALLAGMDDRAEGIRHRQQAHGNPDRTGKGNKDCE